MYLFRAPNCTYYTRICLPKHLRDRGFPFDFKVSLLTKARSVAVTRNFSIAQSIKSLLDSVTINTDIEDFKSIVDQSIDKLRNEFSRIDVVLLPVRSLNTDDKTPRNVSNETRDERGIRLNVALESFITSKQKDKIRPLTVDQLKQRISHFIDSTSVNLVNRVTSLCPSSRAKLV